MHGRHCRPVHEPCERAPRRIRDRVPPRRRRQVGLRRRVQRPRRCRQRGRGQEAAARRSARWSRVPSSQPARRARAASPRRPLAAAEPALAPPRSAPIGWCGGEHQPQAKPFPGVPTEGPERRSKTAAAATPERARESCKRSAISFQVCHSLKRHPVQVWRSLGRARARVNRQVIERARVTTAALVVC